jgi:general secretion pathway protein F
MPLRTNLGRRSAARNDNAVNVVANFSYRALTGTGELVSGTISAMSAAEVAERVQSLGLVPIDNATEQRTAESGEKFWQFSRPRAEDVTVFTRDLALLLRAGARINDALELLSTDIDIGRLRPQVAKIKAAVLAGESFTEAISHHPSIFPPIYVSLIRVGEASGTLDHVLEALATERTRAEALRRRLLDAVGYPAFVFLAACTVLTFFLFFVLPKFGAVLRDFGAKLDPIVVALLNLSDFVLAHGKLIGVALIVFLVVGWVLLRQSKVRHAVVGGISRLPLVRTVFVFYRTALFCRNLSVLLGSGVNLTMTLRILADMMASSGQGAAWSRIVERVRHGSRFSDALADSAVIPAIAVRMLRLGDETGQLPVLAGRVAEFYEAKLQRSVDRVVAIAGPAAIITISLVVGSLIVSVMTALLSVSQTVS